MKKAGVMIVLGFAGLLVLAGCAPTPAVPAGQPANGNGTGTAGQAGPGAKNGGQGNGRRFATIPVQAVTVQAAPLVTDNDTAGTVVPATQSQVAAQVAASYRPWYGRPGTG